MFFFIIEFSNWLFTLKIIYPFNFPKKNHILVYPIWLFTSLNVKNLINFITLHLYTNIIVIISALYKYPRMSNQYCI